MHTLLDGLLGMVDGMLAALDEVLALLLCALGAEGPATLLRFRAVGVLNHNNFDLCMQ